METSSRASLRAYDRRAAIERLDPALYDMTVHDWMFNLAMARQGYIGYIDRVMTVYREHPGGAWSGLTPREQAERLLPLLDAYNAFLGFAYDAEFREVCERWKPALRGG